jgi:serine/threonine protein kinase
MKNEVRIDGQRVPVLERIRIGGRTLLVIERLGHFERPTFRAVERGLTQEVRCVQVLPFSRQASSYLRLLSKISRPQANLPSIIGSHREDDKIYLVTHWIDGPTLSEYLQQCRSGREPWPSVLVVINLVHGLAHGFRLLHDRLGVIHADVNPNNLVLCRHTKRLAPIDFGSALNVERRADRHDGDGATRAYVAPELLEDVGRACFQSDQFSAMAVCYTLLTGEVPYDGLGGRVALANRRGNSPIAFTLPSKQLRHPAQLPARLLGQLDSVMLRGLAISANDRFETTGAWIDALDELRRQLAGESAEMSGSNRWLLKRVNQLGRLLGFD